MKLTAPIKLTPARAWRTYVGGSQIDAIHGLEGRADSQFPEEWIISTVAARNAGREDILHEGMSFVEEDTRSLLDIIQCFPDDALGAAHHRAFGKTTGVLVKIIDAGERLTIQVHPDKKAARELFHSPFGKMECWHILGARTIKDETPCIYLGFREGITREWWEKVFEEQDIPAMLGALHRFEVSEGETYLIPGGVPHAIGAGCLLIEIQEPTDYSVRTERVTPAGLPIPDFMCHQGLGFESMFDCFHYAGEAQEAVKSRLCIPRSTLADTDDCARHEIIGHRDTPCFKLEQYEIRNCCEMEAGEAFSGLYVLRGQGALVADGMETRIKAGDQFFIPASAQPFRLRPEKGSALCAFRCFGPQIPSGAAP